MNSWIKKGLSKKNKERIVSYSLLLFVALGFWVDYLDPIKIWKTNTSVLLPILVCFGLWFLLEQNKRREKNKALLVLSIIFGACQVIAACCNKGPLGIITANFGQIIEASLAVFAYAVCFYQIVGYLLSKVDLRKRNRNKNKKVLKFIFDEHPFAISACFLLVLYLPLLIIFYPGVVQNDTFDELSQFYCVDTWSNEYINPEYSDSCVNTHHSPFHVLVIGSINDVIFNITGKANYALFTNVLVQMLLAVVVFAYSLRLMRDLNTKKWIRILTLILYAFLPYFSIWTITLAKDVPFALMVMLYTCLLIEFFVLKHCTWKEALKICLCAVFLILFSNKSIFFLALISIMVLFVIKPKYKVILASVPIIFYVIYSVVLLPVFHVNAGSIREPLALPIQQVSKVVRYHGDEISEEDRMNIEGLLDYEGISEAYEDTTIDPVKNFLFNKNYETGQLINFGKAWGSLGLRFPFTYISAFLHLYAYNTWIDGNNGVAYFETIRSRDHAKMDYKVNKWHKERMKGIELFYSDLKKMPIVGILFHNAFYLWAVITLLVVLLREKRWRKVTTVIFLPAMIAMLFLFVSPVANNKRYFLPVIWCLPVLFSYFMYYCEKLKKSE